MSSVFYPTYMLISNITLGSPTVVSFASDHDFTVGEVVSFRVSRQYGTYELNNQQSTVSAISSTTITVPIDSTNYNVFIPSPTDPQQLAVVVPAGSGVIAGAIPPQTNLQDAFDNIPGS